MLITDLTISQNPRMGRKESISFRVGNYSKPRVLKEREKRVTILAIGIVMAVVGVAIRLLG